MFPNEECVWLDISFAPWAYPYFYNPIDDIDILCEGQDILACLDTQRRLRSIYLIQNVNNWSYP